MLKISIVSFWVVVIIGNIFGRAFLKQEELSARELGLSGLRVDDSKSTIWIKAVVIGLLLTVICKLIRQANLQAVRIVDADLDMAEIQFSRADYAKEFAELNQLHWHEKPFKQRYARKKE